jgi:hypothetical protein
MKEPRQVRVRVGMGKGRVALSGQALRRFRYFIRFAISVGAVHNDIRNPIPKHAADNL